MDLINRQFLRTVFRRKVVYRATLLTFGCSVGVDDLLSLLAAAAIRWKISQKRTSGLNFVGGWIRIPAGIGEGFQPVVHRPIRVHKNSPGCPQTSK